MKEKLIASLASALEMNPEQIKLEDIFRNYENYSSLTELSVLAMLDEEFGVELEMKDFNQYKTVGDLVSLVNEHTSGE